MVRVFAFKIASVDYRADSLSGKGGEEKLPETPPFPVPAILKTGLPLRAAGAKRPAEPEPVNL